jgi:hypothetical protein
LTKNKKGMSSDEHLESAQAGEAFRIWHSTLLTAHDAAVDLAGLSVHKQHANRLLEPFAWVDVLLSGTNWANFYHRRESSLAQPEFRELAQLMLEAHRASVPVLVPSGWVALPFVPNSELPIASRFAPEDRSLLLGNEAFEGPLVIRGPEGVSNWAKVAVARAARTSYIGSDERLHTVAEETMLFESLLKDGHMSPFEHVAIAQSLPSQSGNFMGWTQLRKLIPNEWDMPSPDGEVLWSDDPASHLEGRVRLLNEV